MTTAKTNTVSAKGNASAVLYRGAALCQMWREDGTMGEQKSYCVFVLRHPNGHFAMYVSVRPDSMVQDPRVVCATFVLTGSAMPLWVQDQLVSRGYQIQYV